MCEKIISDLLKNHFEEIEKQVDYNSIHSYFIDRFNIFWDKLKPQINSKNIPLGDFGKMGNTLSFWLWYETRNLISDEIETIVLKVFLTEDNYEFYTKDSDDSVIIELLTSKQFERRKVESKELHQFLKEKGITRIPSYTPNIVSYIKEEMNEEKYSKFYQEVASIIHRTISKHIIYKKFEFLFMLLTLTGGTIEEIKKMIFGLEHEIKVYKEKEGQKRRDEETSTDTMVEKLIKEIADTRTIAPSFKLLSDKTGDSEYLWKNRLINDSGFLEILKRKLESKYKQAKPSKRNDNKKFWGDVWVYWYERIDNRIKKLDDRKRNELVKNSIQKTKGKGHSFNKFKGKDYDEADFKPQKGKPTCRSCHQLEAVKQGYCEDCFDIYGTL